MKLRSIVIVAYMGIVAFSSLAATAQEYCPLPRDAEILTPHVWPVLDANGDGVLSFQEIYALDSSFEMWQFLLVDQNRDGYISIEEALPWVDSFIDYAFDYIDKNRNGVIEYSEVSHIISRERFDLADTNGDGVFDCQDLETLPPDYPVPCFNNLVEDANFAAGASGNHWIATTDALFCSTSICEDGQPYRGNGWLRFYPRITDDVLSVEQTLVFPTADTASLTYHYRSSPDAQGWLFVTVGDVPVDTLVVSGTETGYVSRTIDISVFANGQAHVLMFANPSLGGSYLDIGQVCVQADGGVHEEPAEGELAVGCPLPVFSATEGILLAWPHLDLNGDGLLSLREIRTVYPQFDSEWFDWFDKNGDGAVSLQEAFFAAQSLENADDIVASVDLNGDRALQYDELTAFLTLEQFEALDQNGNGALDCDDLTWLQGLPPSPPPLVDDPDEEGEGEGEDEAEGEFAEEGEEDAIEDEEGEVEEEPDVSDDPGDDPADDPDEQEDPEAPVEDEGEDEPEEEPDIIEGEDAEEDNVDDEPVEEQETDVDGDEPQDDSDEDGDSDDANDQGDDETIEDDPAPSDEPEDGDNDENGEEEGGMDDTEPELGDDDSGGDETALEGDSDESSENEEDDAALEETQAGCFGRRGKADKIKRFLADYLLLGVAGVFLMRLPALTNKM